MPRGDLLFLDGSSGAAGDMLLGALIDLGVPPRRIRPTLERLRLPGWTLRTRRVQRAGLAVRRAVVRVDDGAPPRTRKDLHRLLRRLPAGRLRDTSTAVFERLLGAEARVHGTSPDRVHLHEAGATDALIDVVGTVAAWDALGAPRVVASPLVTGFGEVRCAHGVYPVPAPAVLELCRGLPVQAGTLEFERLTPTGAALVATLVDAWTPLPPMRPVAVGYGAGRRDPGDHPNALRAVLGISLGGSSDFPAPVVVLECDVDDDNPQVLADVDERLRAGGAVDVTRAAVSMKKGRLGIRVTVVARRAEAAGLAAILLDETATLGVRCREETRWELPRRTARVTTPWGEVAVKVATLPDGRQKVWPEYDDCRRVARRHGVPLRDVQRAALAAGDDDR